MTRDQPSDEGRLRHRLPPLCNKSTPTRAIGFPDLVSSVTTEFGLDPGVLILEVTEAALPSLLAGDALHEVRRRGVPIAMDDFGAGLSSLTQLASLPVDILKMDRGFIGSMDTANGRRVVASVIRLANELGLTTVAEGVELAEEAATLREFGCALAQGYHFAHPMPVADLAMLLPRYAAAPV